MCLCSWCGFNTFFGVKAVFGLDLCHLFPQRVWADIPLIESVQVHSSYRLPGHGGSSWLLVTGPSTAAAAGCTPQEEGAVVGTRLQGPQQQWWQKQQQSMPTAGVWCGSRDLHPPLELMQAVPCCLWAHRERSSYGEPEPLLWHSPIMAPCPSAGPKLLPRFPQLCHSISSSSQAVFRQPIPVLSVTSGAQASVPSPNLSQQADRKVS